MSDFNIIDYKSSLSSMTAEEFSSEWTSQLGNMSYYNAAEGGSWSREASGRAVCSSKLSVIREVANKKGYQRPEGNFLC